MFGGTTAATRKRLALAYTFLLSCNFAILSTDAATNYVGLVPCPTVPGFFGYTNTTLLNQDIQTDVINFSLGIVKTTYFYALCPDTLFNLTLESSQPIVPLLSNSIFSCGVAGTADGNCVLSGGNYHFLGVEKFPLVEVIVRGLTFEGVQGTSIYGNAHPSSSIHFVNCNWRNNVGISTIYLWFESNESSDRRLNADDIATLDVESMITRLAATTSQLRIQEEHHRTLQVKVRYSMVLSFNNCTFKNNIEKIATIFNVGGVVVLSSTSFEGNIIDQFGVFSSVAGGHAYVLEECSFQHNVAPLGPVYVDFQSFLQYSAGNEGRNNTGGPCTGLFLEEEGSTCYIEYTRCAGECCAFGDDSCDLYTDSPTKSPSASPTANTSDTTATSSPTASPMANMIDTNATSSPTASPIANIIDTVATSSPTAYPFANIIKTIATSSPTETPFANIVSTIATSRPTAYPTRSPTADPGTILRDDPVLAKASKDDNTFTLENKGFFLVLTVGIPVLIVTMLLGLWLVQLRNMKKRREVIADTEMAESQEMSSGRDLGDIQADLSPVA